MLKIIVSPAKKMKHNDEVIDWDQLPPLLDQTRVLQAQLQRCTYAQLKDIWQCNDQIATLNEARLRNLSLTHRLTPAVLAYEGLQYQYMAPQVFDVAQWDYVRQHLVILSGFYGLLRATDGITPYRLEMQAKLKVGASKNLYDFWKDTLYTELVKDVSVVVNLASKEYSKTIERYVDDRVCFVTCTFAEWVKTNGEKKIKTKATAAKMARGEMVRFMAEHDVQDVERLKGFDRLGYAYSAAHSTKNQYVFLKHNEKEG